MHHSPNYVNTTMKMKSQQINVNMLQETIGASLVKCLLFVNAISGCNATTVSSELESLKHESFYRNLPSIKNLYRY